MSTSLVELLRQNQPELPRLVGDILAGRADDEARATAALAVAEDLPPGEESVSGGESVAVIPVARLRVLVLPFEVDAAAAAASPLAYLPSELLRAQLANVGSLDMLLPSLPFRPAKPAEDAPEIGATDAASDEDAPAVATPADRAREANAAVVVHGRVTLGDAGVLTIHAEATRVPPASAEAAEPKVIATLDWTAAVDPADALLATIGERALTLLRAFGMPARAAEVEKAALPLTDSAAAATMFGRAMVALETDDRPTAVRCLQMALHHRPALRPLTRWLTELAPHIPLRAKAPKQAPDTITNLAAALEPYKSFRAIARQIDPSLPVWIATRPLAERDDFSALTFSNEGMMGAGLDALIEALLAIPADALVVRLCTGMLESHLCREDTPLPAHHVQWQMPLDHPGNRVLFEREQKRAWLTLSLARALLGIGHVDDARDQAKYVVERFAHLTDLATYAGQFLKDLEGYDAPSFRVHRRDNARAFAMVRTYVERLWATGYCTAARQNPGSRVRPWAVERPALSWNGFAADWEHFNVLAREKSPPFFPLDPDETEAELLRQLWAERKPATTGVGKRLALRPLSWLGSETLEQLRAAKVESAGDPSRLSAVMAGLVRAGEPPTAEEFGELVASDPLAAARFIRSLTPAVVTEPPGSELALPPIRPEKAAAVAQASRIPDAWRPNLWICLNALPRTAKVEAGHLVALLGRNPKPDEEDALLAALQMAPEDASVALLRLKSTRFPIDAGFPQDQAGWCLAWRARFKESGPAALIHLLPEGPGWMTTLGKELADLVPLAMLAPTRLATEVSKRRAEKGYPEKDMLYIEELASGAMAADQRPQSSKVATMILQQIIQRWPPWNLSLGDHVWLFGTLERLEMEEDPDALAVILDLGRKTFDELQGLEQPEFDEQDIARERYYTDNQLLLVEILKRVVVSLEGRDSDPARKLLSDVITQLRLPAQGHLIPFVESAIIAQGPWAVQMVENWLDAPDTWVVGAAHRILRHLRGPIVDDKLANWLGQAHPVRRQLAYETLRLRGADAAPLIARMLLSPGSLVQMGACALLSRIRPHDLADFDFSPLAGIIAEAQDRRVLRNACLAAAVHGVESAWQPVAERLVNWPDEDRPELLEAAARCGGKKACPFLIRALQSDYPDEVQLAWQHLLDVTGQVFACDPAPWALWWVRTTDDMSLPRPAEKKRQNVGMRTVITQLPGAFASEIHEPSKTILEIGSAARTTLGVRGAIGDAAAERAAAKAKRAVEEAMKRRMGDAAPAPAEDKPTRVRMPVARKEEPEPAAEDLPEVVSMDLDDATPSVEALTTFINVDPKRVKSAEVFDSAALSQALGGEMFFEEDDVASPDELFGHDSTAESARPTSAPPAAEPRDAVPVAGNTAGGLEALDDFDDDLPDPFELSAAMELGDLNYEEETSQRVDLRSLPEIGLETLMSGGDVFQPAPGASGVGGVTDGGVTSSQPGVARPAGMATIVGVGALMGGDEVAPDEFESLDDFSGSGPYDHEDEDPPSSPGGGSGRDSVEPAYDLPDEMPGEPTDERALVEETLVNSPVNDVSGTFPLASLHGNGVGQWLSTNPDRFYAEGPAWFLVGRSEIDRYNFSAPFHIVTGGFELVLGPYAGGGFQLLRIDTAHHAANQWWTLMIERAGEHCWFRIAERDTDWHALHGRVEVAPLASVGISFGPGSDVAFGDLIFEPTEKAPMVSQILGGRGGRGVGRGVGRGRRR